jgi:hypothetical protein
MESTWPQIPEKDSVMVGHWTSIHLTTRHKIQFSIYWIQDSGTIPFPTIKSSSIPVRFHPPLLRGFSFKSVIPVSNLYALRWLLQHKATPFIQSGPLSSQVETSKVQPCSFERKITLVSWLQYIVTKNQYTLS